MDIYPNFTEEQCVPHTAFVKRFWNTEVAHMSARVSPPLGRVYIEVSATRYPLDTTQYPG